MQACDDFFDNNDATVACRQLGLPTPGRWLDAGVFGPGQDTLPIWIDNISCSGAEAKIEECKGMDWVPVRSCQHSEDVGVLCGIDTGETLVRHW